MTKRPTDASGTTLYCSFCGKSEQEVDVLVTERSCAICDECVDVAVTVVAERREKRKAKVEETT